MRLDVLDQLILYSKQTSGRNQKVQNPSLDEVQSPVTQFRRSL